MKRASPWRVIGPTTPGVAPFDGQQVLVLTTDLDEPRTHGFWQEGVEADGSDGYWLFAGWCWTHDHYYNATTQPDEKPDCDCVEDVRPVMWAPIPSFGDAELQTIEKAAHDLAQKART